MSSSHIRGSHPAESSGASLIESVFPGDGEMARRMREYAWEKTALGPVSEWPQSLRTSVSICLASRFPIVLYWGPEYVVLYNDAYSEILGSKHPWALGQTCRDCWAEIWDTIGPMLDGVMETGKATWSDDLLLRLERFGHPEECYFSFSFGPVQLESGKVGGVFTAVLETTQKVIGERRLLESEHKLQVVTDATPVMIWLSGIDKLCYYFNKSWLDFVGRSLEQELGNGWAENVHPDDFDRCVQTYVTSFDARQPFEMEYRLRHHSGQYRWILDHGVPRFAPDGTFEGYVGGCLDIHEQKEAAEKVRVADEALRESEERLRLAQQAAGIGTFEWNIGTGIIRWTPELERMYGLQPGTFDGTQEAWERRVHPEDLPLLIKQREAAFQTDAPVQAEWRVIWPDGTVHWVLGRWQAFRDESGKPIRVAGINIDVTTRKADEEARRRLAAIVESSDDAIVSKDLNGIVTSWNRQAQRLFGYTEEEMIGRSILTIIPPELHSDEDMILSKIRRGEKIDHFETVRVAKSGERIDVSLSISPVKDENGNIVGAAKIARDIRETKKIEHALRTTEKLAAAGRLAATVAHEINNPLEAVTNLVYLALRDLPDVDRAAAHLRSAERELNRVSHITRQTLGFYRDTSSPVRLQLSNAIDDLLLLYDKRLENRNIRVVKQYENGAEVVALSGEIRQALSNLLTNAMDAMVSGGTLILRLRKVHAWRGDPVEGVRITFADSGSGIPAQNKPNLFQPFFTTKSDVGTGLGLWITRGIVEKHGGRIDVKSRTGPRHGTAFSIFLPAHGRPLPKPLEALGASTQDGSVLATAS